MRRKAEYVSNVFEHGPRPLLLVDTVDQDAGIAALFQEWKVWLVGAKEMMYERQGR